MMAGIVISFMAPRYWLTLVCARTHPIFVWVVKKIDATSG